MTRPGRDTWLTALWAGLVPLLLGVVMGTAWWLIAPDLTFDVRKGGVYAAVSTPSDWFAADAWFMVLGLTFGVVVGVLTYWSRRDHPLAAGLGMTVGCVGMGLLAWWTGWALGPDTLKAQAVAASAGDQIFGPLTVQAHGVLLAPVVAALAVYGALVASTPTERPDVQEPVPTGAVEQP